MKRILLMLSLFTFIPVVFAQTTDANVTPEKPLKHHKQRAKKKVQAPQVYEDDKTEPETASSGFSGNLTIISNYMFRGISLTKNKPAFQGSLTYTFPIGFYLNTWGSNTNFVVPNGNTATSEIDTLAGFRRTFLEDFTIDVNFARYNYPGARSGNYNELNTYWIYKILQLGINYTSNYSGYHGRGLYTAATVTLPIPPQYFFKIENVTIAGEMGHYSLSKVGGNSYNDYSVTLNKKFNDTYSVLAQWTGTNGRAHLPPYDSDQFIGAVIASF